MADSVRMIAQDPFVGAHTPCFAAGSGMQQHDLGLLGDKAYVAYVWLTAAAGNPVVTVTLTTAEGACI